jgi:hypothetical protein
MNGVQNVLRHDGHEVIAVFGRDLNRGEPNFLTKILRLSVALVAKSGLEVRP